MLRGLIPGSSLSMIRVGFLGCAALVLACHAATQPAALTDPDPDALIGRWHLELRQGSLLPFSGVPALGAPAPWLLGELHLEPFTDSVGLKTERIDAVGGTFIGLLPRRNADADTIRIGAIARIQPGNNVALTLTLPGPCPCQTLELSGVLFDGEIEGHYTQNTGGMQVGGRFRLRRPD
jgi:hypothetical protein